MQLNKIFFFSLLFFAISNLGVAQLNNKPFEKRFQIDTTSEEILSFNLRVLGFNKNNEYYNKINQGYTLFGYRVSPTVAWKLQRDFKIEGGVFIQKDFGNNKLTHILPVLNMIYSWNGNQLLFGNLNGSVNHRQIEPMEDIERLMNDVPEMGVQLTKMTSNLFLDAWINWETMIYPGSNFKERLSGGLVYDQQLLKSDYQSLNFHYEFKGFHTGGQIDVLDEPLVIVFNNSFGMSWERALQAKKLNSLKFEGHFLHFTDQSNTPRLIFMQGYGYYLNGQLSTHFGDFMLSYWYGDHFYSYKGGRLYQSISTDLNSEAYEEVRQLLILRVLNEIKIGKDINLILRFEPFWDLRNKKFEFSHALYVNLFKTIPIKK